MAQGSTRTGSEGDGVLARTLQRRALRQSATLRAASAAIAHAPTLDDCAASIQRAREELEHLEHSVECYRDLTGLDLTRELERETSGLLVPTSWVEASVAQLVLCLAARIDASHQLSTRRPKRRLIREIAEESEHVNAARAALFERDEGQPGHLGALLRLATCWAEVALATLQPELDHAFRDALAHELTGLGVLRDASAFVA